eukprot:9281783-Heterocapsa_arctica.AAC.1
MPVAAAAVARAFPVTELPDPTPREKKEIMEAFVNGKRKQSADAEFRRCVKETLLYRMKWDH